MGIIQMTDLITRNLRDQSGNLGRESVVVTQNGVRQFVDARTGATLNRSVQPDAFELENAPLDNSFQIDPQSFNVSKGLWEQPGVPESLSRLFGVITAVTAKDQGVSANRLFASGQAADALLENINFFRTSHSQIGVNDGDPAPAYTNNYMLAAKVSNQTR
jgi:hypothetical protein